MRPPKHPREPHREPPEHAKPPQETPQDTPRALRDPPEHAKAPQETPQDPPGDPQEAPKAPQGSLLSRSLAAFWRHFGSRGGPLDGCLIFHGFLMLFGSLVEPILVPFSIQKCIIFVSLFCMFFVLFFDSLFLQFYIHL